jgi:cephalosporin hydroxylase
MVRIYPMPWTRAFREPNFALARATLRHDAAQKIRELTGLIAFLRDRPLRTVVEIGSDRGGTLYTWCRLAEPDALVISVDLPGGAFSRGEIDLRRATRDYPQHEQRLEFVFGDSHDPETKAELERVLEGRPVDFLLIDGDHSYDGVKRDFEMYSPLVRSGGAVAFHDVLPNELSAASQVDRYWTELKSRYETREFVDTYDDRGRGQWGGIGVVIVR